MFYVLSYVALMSTVMVLLMLFILSDPMAQMFPHSWNSRVHVIIIIIIITASVV
jgi:hypothetical protein